jgi:flagellar hook protein FlgE
MPCGEENALVKYVGRPISNFTTAWTNGWTADVEEYWTTPVVNISSGQGTGKDVGKLAYGMGMTVAAVVTDGTTAIETQAARAVSREAGVAAKGTNFFRGARAGEAPSFTPRRGEFKVDPKTGFVKDTHGVSVFDNPSSVSSMGLVPHQVDQSTVPDSLRMIQRGKDPSHFEIVPQPGANLTPAQFTGACNNILCIR